MPLIWCSISGHGFGHAAQTLPVLNELGRRAPGTKAILRTTVPPWFFAGRLDIPWEISPAEQDIGCVQQGPLHIHVAKTWAEHRRLHADWEKRVEEEARAIRSAAPDLVVSNISHLSIEAAALGQVPAIGLCSLSWDLVLEPFLDQEGPERAAQAELIRQIRRSYAMAALMLRPAPGLPMNAFRTVVDVGPIVQPIRPNPPQLRKAIGASPDELVVLVGFGGIALDALPYERLERLNRYRFLVNGTVPKRFRRIRSATSVPLPFGSLLASADLIVTKPGYSTIVEAVAHARPVVYVRRYTFADEAGLVEYVHRFGRATELPAEDFAAGRWQDALRAVCAISQPTELAPAPIGAAEAAALLAAKLKGQR